MRAGGAISNLLMLETQHGDTDVERAGDPLGIMYFSRSEDAALLQPALGKFHRICCVGRDPRIIESNSCSCKNKYAEEN